MATVKKLLDTAKKELGVKESPPNSNNVKYNTWFYGKPVVGSAYPWCAVFVFEMCKKAGVKVPVDFPEAASCGAWMRAAKTAGMWVTSGFQPGDIAIFDFSGNKKTTQHCGIIESVLDNSVKTIEGNTGTSSDSDGGEVMRRTRANKFIIGVVRPVYDTEIKKEDIFEMTIQEFLNKLTDEQAYTLLTKAQRYAGTLEEPSWSKNEGHWQKAKENGVINGGQPEGLIKRDEVIAILGRKGVI